MKPTDGGPTDDEHRPTIAYETDSSAVNFTFRGFCEESTGKPTARVGDRRLDASVIDHQLVDVGSAQDEDVTHTSAPAYGRTTTCPNPGSNASAAVAGDATA